MLAIRSLHEAEARVMPGTEGVTQAFWAPDSQFVAFFADDKLKKVDLRGGPPRSWATPLCTRVSLPRAPEARGAPTGHFCLAWAETAQA